MLRSWPSWHLPLMSGSAAACRPRGRWRLGNAACVAGLCGVGALSRGARTGDRAICWPCGHPAGRDGPGAWDTMTVSARCSCWRPFGAGSSARSPVCWSCARASMPALIAAPMAFPRGHWRSNAADGAGLAADGCSSLRPDASSATFVHWCAARYIEADFGRPVSPMASLARWVLAGRGHGGMAGRNERPPGRKYDPRLALFGPQLGLHDRLHRAERQGCGRPISVIPAKASSGCPTAR
jgi:hypothetical protein